MFKGRKGGSTRRGGRGGRAKLHHQRSHGNLEFETVPPFLARQAQGRYVPLGKNSFTSPTKQPVHTEFNYKRSGGRFTLATSPLQTKGLQLERTKSPFLEDRADNHVYGKHAMSDYKIASEVLKVVSKHASKKGKEVNDIVESEVLDLLLMDVDKVLSTPFAYRAFLAFAVNEYSDELLRFHKDISHYNKLYKGLLPFDVARRIHDEYIAAESPSEINVSGTMKVNIENALAKARPSKQYVDIAAFDAIIFEVRSLIEDQTFRRFKEKVRKSYSYAQDVWSMSVNGCDDLEAEHADSVMLYNLFEDIRVGLDKLKALVKQTRKDSQRRAYQKPTLLVKPDALYHKDNAIMPSRLRSLRHNEY